MNARLGFPEDARLLIINADDFGMCQATNAATIQAMRGGIVSSTTVMTPCPRAPHALRLLAHNPDLAFGVHLTLIAEHPLYRWGPLAGRGAVPSLVDAAGARAHGAQSTQVPRERPVWATVFARRVVPTPGRPERSSPVPAPPLAPVPAPRAPATGIDAIAG